MTSTILSPAEDLAWEVAGTAWATQEDGDYATRPVTSLGENGSATVWCEPAGWRVAFDSAGYPAGPSDNGTFPDAAAALAWADEQIERADTGDLSALDLNAYGEADW